MGLIWGRNHNCGDPREPKRVRLTYFTPIVDILADVQQNHAHREEVALPVYSTTDLARDVRGHSVRPVVDVDLSRDPWNAHSRAAIQQRRRAQATLIRDNFIGVGVPSSGVVLDRHPQDDANLPPDNPSTTRSTNLRPVQSSASAVGPSTPSSRSDTGSLVSTLRSQGGLLLGLGGGTTHGSSPPDLYASSSIRSDSSVPDVASEVASLGNGVRIAGESDIGDITDVEEPVRAKASFSQRYPGLLIIDTSC
ncbi:hypothetical protein VTI74DRAFT_5905 [Chaetomium olivicolor]